MGNRNFEMHQYRQVIVRMRLGDSDRAIAKTGLMGRTKSQQVRKVAEEKGWLDASQAPPDNILLALAFDCESKAAPTPSLIEPYRDEVTQWWQQSIQGTTIHQALIRKHNYQGSYSSVRRFLQTLNQQQARSVTSVIDCAPGDSVQVDFGKGPTITDVFTGEVITTWIFVMVLSWSRHQYSEIIRDQTVETWLGCHRRAFEAFNGVPVRVVIDNPKCAITRACYHDPQVQRAYAECAEGYGFLISPCPVRDPQKKGRVESGVKYVKNHFVPLREFRSLVDANEQLKVWVHSTAGNRNHGTTHEKPLTRFMEVERHILKPLPARPPELVRWANVKLHGDCHVQFEKCRYSAPYKWVHQQLWLRASPTLVQLFIEHELIASHPHLKKPGKRSTLQEHLPPNAQAYNMRDPQWCLKQAEKVGSDCLAVIESLFADRVLDNLRAAQGILQLKKPYGAVRLEAACKRALAFNNIRYRAIKSILHQGLDQEHAQEEFAFDSLSDTYLGQGRFCRDTKKIFNH